MPIIEYIVPPDDVDYKPRDEYWYMTNPLNYEGTLFGSGFNVTACNHKDQPCP